MSSFSGRPELPAGIAGLVAPLAARWASSQPGSESFVISPVALWPLLAGLGAAAAGPAREELEEAAGLGGLEAVRVAAQVLAALAAGTATSAASAVWVAEGVRVLPGVIDDVFGGARVLPRDEAAVAAALDRWVAEATGGQITRYPVVVGPDDRMTVAAAATVDTRWERPFVPWGLTAAAGPWGGRSLPGLVRIAGRDTSPLQVTDGPAAGRVTLATVRGASDVDVHLAIGEPDAPGSAVVADAVAAVAGLSPARYIDTASVAAGTAAAPAVTTETRVGTRPEPGGLTVLRVPKFALGQQHDLLARAGLFGLTAAVADGDHFPGLADEPLSVAAAAQYARAEFTAEGFTAAAVTAVTARIGASSSGSGPVESLAVVFDRPFGFVAADRRTGLALFAGWVADPDPSGGVAGEAA